MPTLLDMIREFGELSYEAGVHEREPDFVEKADAAKELFQQIIWRLEKEEEVVIKHPITGSLFTAP